MKTEWLSVSDQIVSAGFTGICQGLAITVVVALVMRFSRTNAATRHVIWSCTLLLVIGLIAGQAWVDPPPGASAQAPEGADQVAPEPGLELDHGTATLGMIELPDPGQGASGTDPLQQYSLNSIEEFAYEAESHPLAQAIVASFSPQSDSSKSLAVNLSEWLAALRENPLAWQVRPALPRGASLALLTCAVGAVLFRLIVLLRQYGRIQRLKRGSRPACAELEARFAELRTRLSPNRGVELGICPEIASPLLLGFARPMIALPADSSGEEAVLRHELAHVRRRDDWVNLAQQIVEALMIFHPAVWWITRRLVVEREIACDDQVLHNGGGRRAYALMLVGLAARRQHDFRLLAPGASANRTQLEERIDMILNTNRDISPRLAVGNLAAVLSAVILLAVLAMAGGPRISVAQTVRSKPGPGGPDSALPGETPKPAPAQGALPGQPPFATPPGVPAPVALAGADSVPGAPATPAGPPIGYAPGETLQPGRNPYASTLQNRPHPRALAQADDAPKPPGARPKPSPDGSIEARMERLERMVESLLAQQNRRPGYDGGYSGDANLEKHWHHNYAVDEEAIKEQAKREAAITAYQDKRLSSGANQPWRTERAPGRDTKEGYEKQIEMLSKQIEALDREKQKLSQALEKLVQEQRRLEEQRSSDRPESGKKK